MRPKPPSTPTLIPAASPTSVPSPGSTWTRTPRPANTAPQASFTHKTPTRMRTPAPRKPPPELPSQGKSPLFGTSKHPLPPPPTQKKVVRRKTHQYLDAYIATHTSKVVSSTSKTGKPNKPNRGSITVPIISNLVASDKDNLAWKATLDSPSTLRTNSFGPPDSKHSVTQEGSCETTLFLLVKSNYLDDTSIASLFTTNPLIPHLARMINILSTYDFRWLQDTDTNWAAQTEISEERRKAMMACLFHYNLDLSLLMRFLGGNYIGAHRDVHSTATILLQHGIDKDLVGQYMRVMTVGCPRVMNAHISRDNAMTYW